MPIVYTDVWYRWTTGTAATWTCSSTNSTANVTWYAPGTTNATTASTVWSAWISCTPSTSSTAGVARGTYTVPPPRELTEEEREALLRQREEAARQREEEAKRREEELKRREAAVARAEELLRRFLSAEQLAELEKDGHFHVVTETGRRYRVGRGQHGNVVELTDDGKRLRRFCIQPKGYLPDPDAMLAQKLLLETDEEAFNRIANVTNLAA